jgi:hypothetical protein
MTKDASLSNLATPHTQPNSRTKANADNSE